MGLFKRRNKDEQVRTCPDCCQIVAAEATTCDLCGADLSAGATAPGTPATAAAPGGSSAS